MLTCCRSMHGKHDTTSAAACFGMKAASRIRERKSMVAGVSFMTSQLSSEPADATKIELQAQPAELLNSKMTNEGVEGYSTIEQR